MGKMFCSECRNDVTYSIKPQKMTNTIRGRVYEYNGEIAYCDACGKEIYIPEINDSNLKALYDVYRLQNEIVSTDMISGILEKYNIGKRPLSILLGWGEQTVSRYLDGNIPSKKYSDELKRLYEDPEYYYSMLEREDRARYIQSGQ